MKISKFLTHREKFYSQFYQPNEWGRKIKEAMSLKNTFQTGQHELQP